MKIENLIKKTEQKAGLNPGDLRLRNQRLKKTIGNIPVSELRRALVFIAKQNDQTITYQKLANLIGYKGHSTAIISYRNAQNYYRQGDQKFYKALNLVTKN